MIAIIRPVFACLAARVTLVKGCLWPVTAALTQRGRIIVNNILNRVRAATACG